MGRLMNWLRRQVEPRKAPADQPLSLRPTREDLIVEEAWERYVRLKREINEVLRNNHHHRSQHDHT